MRYIELNPVRAGMVDDPGQYKWSSYRHNGLGLADNRITEHPLYLALSLDESTRMAAYRALFRSQMDDEAIDDMRLALNQGQPLGNEQFKELNCAATGVRQTQVRLGRPMGELNLPSDAKDQSDFGI